MRYFLIPELATLTLKGYRIPIYLFLLLATIVKAVLVADSVLDCTLGDGDRYIRGFHFLVSFFGHPFFEQGETNLACVVGDARDFSLVEQSPGNYAMWIVVGLFYYLVSILTASMDAGDWYAFIQFQILVSAIIWMKVGNFNPIAVFVGLLVVCHPDSITYSTYLGKEAILLFLLAANVYLFKEYKARSKRSFGSVSILIVMVLCFLLGSFIRPYFVFLVYTAVLVTGLFPFKYGIIDYRYLFPAGLLFAIYKTANIFMVAKVYLFTVFALFFSPNFFRATNYEDYLLATMFGVFVFVLGFFNALWGIGRKKVWQLLSLVMMYAIPVALVVIAANALRGSEHTAFNIPRTRYPFSFVYYTIVGILLFNFAGQVRRAHKALSDKV